MDSIMVNLGSDNQSTIDIDTKPATPVRTANVENRKSLCEFDDVFKHVQSFGPYQKIMFFGTCACLIIAMGAQSGLLVLAMGVPNFHCTTANSTCPPNKCCENCTSYVFDEGQYTTTVTEWNLICDRAHIGATIQSCFFAGMLIGSIVGGLVSDAFGRQKCMYIGCILMICTAVGSAFSDCVSLFALLRVLVGAAVAMLMLSQYVFTIEILGPGRRTMAGEVSHVFWGPGYSVVAFFAYFIRDWRYLMVVSSLLALPFLLFCKVFPESPRWLIAHNRLDEAHEFLMKCGGRKNKPIDAVDLRNMINDIHKDQVEREKEDVTKKYTPIDLFRTPKLRRRTLIVAYNWFVVTLVYFGIFLYVTTLAGNIYVNFVIMNTIHIPQFFICWFIMKKFGRRIPHCAYMIVTGIICLLILAVPDEYPLVVTGLAFLGKSFISAVFANIYLYTSELYPTVIRNSAMGLGSMVARVGGILAPYIVMVSQLPGMSVTFPVTVFGVNALVAGVLSLWLPETFYSKLPQTIEEAEVAKEDHSLPCRRRKPVANGGAIEIGLENTSL